MWSGHAYHPTTLAAVLVALACSATYAFPTQPQPNDFLPPHAPVVPRQPQPPTPYVLDPPKLDMNSEQVPHGFLHGRYIMHIALGLSVAVGAFVGRTLQRRADHAGATDKVTILQRSPMETIMHSGKMSPGFNTLPEWEGVATGFEGQVGDQEPLGFWDPAGFTKDGDVEKFKRRREVEIKHGRVAMLACIGYIVPEYFKFDGYISPSQGLQFADISNGLSALNQIPMMGLVQFVAFIAFLELVYNKPSGEPGNYGKGNLGLGSIGLGSSITDTKLRTKKLSAEMANGRLAMVAIIGMFFQDGLTGAAWGDWALFTDSPIR